MKLRLQFALTIVPTRDLFQDPHWVPETAGSTEPYMHHVFFPIHTTYDKV